VRQVTGLLGVGFAGVAVVSDDGRLGEGVYAELDGREPGWWRDVRLDLRNEPSGIANAVFDAAPVAVYDLASSPLVSPRLAKLVGARSGAWIPMIAEERVIGVLVVASTDAKRAFSSDELALLQAVAAEGALALERVRSAAALSDALGREQKVAAITRRIRGELDPDGVVGVAREELQRALQLVRSEIVLGAASDGGTPIIAHGERIGALFVERAAPLDAGEMFLVDTVADEIGASLQTAGLLVENQRRLEQQAALLRTAQVVTSELDLDGVLTLLVEEVTKLLDADAADCYLLDHERGVLRCAAVHGFTQDLVGFEFTSANGIAEPVPNPAYADFSRALVAPMVWAGETRGVLGTRSARRDTQVFRGGPRDARGVRVARLACSPQRGELCGLFSPGADPARLLPDRDAARRAGLIGGDLRRSRAGCRGSAGRRLCSGAREGRARLAARRRSCAA